ncbi:MAG: Bug family tripartite tricarboxylate transporter substrate binding protein [Rhodospirillaceae bacterium]
MDVLRCAALALLMATAPVAANAQSGRYPTKPIRLVLPFPPGAPSDLVGRAVAQKLGEQLGENVIPDNRVGAGGNLGLSLVAKAPPDGYTLMVSSPTIALSPWLYRKLPYDPEKDFAPVAPLAVIENVMLVHPNVPAKTLKDFIALAKARPGKLNYGSGGAGTTNHLANELLKYLTKIDIVHVPYKGATLATLALAGGEVDQVIVSVSSVLPLIHDRKVRPIVVLSQKRVAALPDVPTSAESGMPDFLMSIWFAMYAPAATPRELVTRLNKEVVRALESPDMRQKMAGIGIDPWVGTPEQLAQWQKKETARYGTIIKSAGIQPE